MSHEKQKMSARKWKAKEAEDAVLKIVRDGTGMGRRRMVSADVSFQSLGLDYTDLILIVADCVRAFDIKIGDEHSMKDEKVGNLITVVRGALREDGRLIE